MQEPLLKKAFFDALSWSNVNSLWSAITAEVLFRLGLRYAVIAPGSRSTPLTFAFSRHPEIKTIPILDERSASFFALGLARQTHRPVTLVCTSGTAAANFYPAIIEARESAVPLFIMTADRPPEARHCHSGQTIDQLKIYGTYPNFQAELALPSNETSRLNYLRQTLLHAWERLTYPAAGPVHLNVPFRDPLTPDLQTPPLQLEKGFNLQQFVAEVEPPPKVKGWLDRAGKPSFSVEMGSIANGLIVAGPAQPENAPAYCKAVSQVAQRLAWPVLTDGLSPLRNYAKLNPYLISHYPVLLSNSTLAKALVPDTVLSIGPLPTSKVLRVWLERQRVKTWVLDAGVDNVDAIHRGAIPIRLSVETFAAIFEGGVKEPSTFSNKWFTAEAQAARGIVKKIGACKFNFEGKVAWLLSRSLPPKTPLFIANSMAVRDVESFWSPNNRAIQPFFNRGANGIDGTLSTALGIAHENKSAVLLTGDLALLHDTNGFLISQKFKGHLSIVLLNNQGSGIFETLPIAKLDPPFEEYFAMPQSVSFKKLVTAYKIDYVKVKNLNELPQLLRKLPPFGVRLLEIITNRKRDQRWREKTFQEVSAHL